MLLYGYGAYEISIDPTFSVGPAQPARPRRGLRDRARARRRRARTPLVRGRQALAQAQLVHRLRRAAPSTSSPQGYTSPDRPRGAWRQRRRAAHGRGRQPGPDRLPGHRRRGAVRRLPHHDPRPRAPAHRHRVGGVGQPARRPRGLRVHQELLAVRQRRTPPPIPRCSSPAGCTTRACSTGSRRSGSPRLRRPRPTTSSLVLKTEMDSGHSGPSGRYDAWRDEAFVLAFVLDQIGVERCSSSARRIVTSADGTVLEAELRAAARRRAPRPCVLCHPHPQYGGSMRSLVIGELFRALPAHGVDVPAVQLPRRRGQRGRVGRRPRRARRRACGDRRARRAHRRADRRSCSPAGRSAPTWRSRPTTSASAAWLAVAPPLHFADRSRRVGRDPRPEAPRARRARPGPRADDLRAATAQWRATTIEVVQRRRPLLRGPHRPRRDRGARLRRRARRDRHDGRGTATGAGSAGRKRDHPVAVEERGPRSTQRSPRARSARSAPGRLPRTRARVRRRRRLPHRATRGNAGRILRRSHPRHSCVPLVGPLRAQDAYPRSPGRGHRSAESINRASASRNRPS